MSLRATCELSSGYTSEVDTADDLQWCRILQEFDDANIYQTWAYTAVTAGSRNTSHLILKKNQEIAAVAQVRIVKLPLLRTGIAYVRWGPLWRRWSGDASPEVFRQALRALRNEFVCRRGLVLRLFPLLFSEDPACFGAILAQEGFTAIGNATTSTTILMDVRPPVDELRNGMNAHWKRELKVAERKGLEVVEGTDDHLFSEFLRIYREMLARKRFVEGNDINQFRSIQARLPESLKMQIMLCNADGTICSGLIYTAIGNTAIYLFGATSSSGLKSRGSYLLQWLLLSRLKEKNITVYNLNGINPVNNPGTYKFKVDLAGQQGRNVSYLGRFDSRPNAFSYSCVEGADTLRKMSRALRVLANNARERLVLVSNNEPRSARVLFRRGLD